MAHIFKKKTKAKPELTESEIIHLTSHTKLTREQVEENFVDFLEKNPDGKITKSNFKNLLSISFPSLDSDKHADHIFKMFDSDKSGSIAFNEFLTVIYIFSSGSPAENLKLIFKIYDRNKDGKISKREVKKISKDFSNLLTVGDVGKTNEDKLIAKKFMEEMDNDGDGKVSEEEFMEFITKSNVAKILTFRILESFIKK